MADDMFDYLKKASTNLSKTFNDFFSTDYKKPFSDITQGKKDVVVSFKMPGIGRKNIVLEITKEKIEVRGEQKKTLIKKSKKRFSEEKSYKGYHRIISLPVGLETENAIAEYKGDTLFVRIPKIKKMKKIIAH